MLSVMKLGAYMSHVLVIYKLQAFVLLLILKQIL
jgi:hypothetical protein